MSNPFVVSEPKTQSVILAIDPGLSGTLVILELNGTYVDHLSMPSLKVGTKNRVNGAATCAWIAKYPIAHVFLEQVHSMPRDGAAGAFSFGHSAGLIEGIITALALPLTLVPPQTWKKFHGLLGTEKDAARSRAIQLFPGIRTLDSIGKGQALADALLLGRYGLTQLHKQVA
jgi:crossover junction endodeoxyribonuclease RuvC